MNNISLAVAPAFGNVNLPFIPEELRALRQFVLFKLIPNPKKTKPDKVPFDAKTGKLASSTYPASWASWEQVANIFMKGGYDGIGFAFTPDDGYIFLDLDDCTENGQLKPYAQAIWQTLPATWEWSQSGQGLHAIMRVVDKTAFAGRRDRWEDAHNNKHELYTHARFIMFGKQGFNRADIPTLDAVAMAYLLNLTPLKPDESNSPIDWEQPAPASSLDEDVIARGFRNDSENYPYYLFGGMTTLLGEILPSKPPENVQPGFIAMWEGDERLGKIHSANDNSDPFNRSSVEMALANKLAWLTEGNPAWIERLMNQSPLCQREKWQKRSDYRRSTIEKAVNGFRAEQRRRRIEEDKRIGDEAAGARFPEIFTLDTALERLVFVQHGSFVVDRHTKAVLSLNDAERAFAASKYTTETMREIPIMKLWVQHPNRRSVDVMVWSPGDPEFCNALERNQAGSHAYNLWAGLPLLPAPDDWRERVQPFLNHVSYLVPIPAECEGFLNWCAHMLQKPEELPHTHYLMVATEKGIGRGTLCSILTRVLRGHVASNIDVNKTLFGDFNGRLSQKLLATVDEVREGLSDNRWRNAESLKSALTTERRHINVKYGLQSVEKNCVRFLLCSNHHDALPFDFGDRRINVIENPSDKRTDQYFNALYDLLKDDQFIASVQRYLLERDISAYNPFEPAPLNAAKEKALRSLESDTERAVRQFQQDWPGRFAARHDLRKFIGSECKDTALRRYIERAGMKTGDRLTVGGTKETLLIVRGGIRPEDLRPEMNESIAAEILEARSKFEFPQIPHFNGAKDAND